MKRTRPIQSIHMQDPQFNLIAFTQPCYMVNFHKNSTNGSFFKRFLTSVLKEQFINNELDIEKMLHKLYQDRHRKKIRLVVPSLSDAKKLYSAHIMMM